MKKALGLDESVGGFPTHLTPGGVNPFTYCSGWFSLSRTEFEKKYIATP